MIFIFLLFLPTYLFSQIENCSIDLFNNRSIYNIGDVLSNEDQERLFPVCNGADGYTTGDSFSFADLNGDLNGGDYKITIISMNATW